MKKSTATVAVIGTGGAGLSAAVEAAAAGAKVRLITRNFYTHDVYRWASDGGCTWKTHAFNAAVAEGDSVDAHLRDTLKGGALANDPALARVLCAGAVQLIPWLESFGLEFERDDEGRLGTRPFGGCGSARAVFLKDMLGFHISRVLRAEVDRLVTLGRVQVLGGLRATGLRLGDNGEICGVKAMVPETLEMVEVPCRAVVLADGGGASMYAPSAASSDKTCDGLALGLAAGAEAIDMEFVQFHPTGLVSEVPALSGSLVEEAVRFDGAELRNRHGERFMFKYHPAGEKATRDEVSRGIYREILAGRAFANHGVILNVRACRGSFAEKYPALDERLRQAGFDPVADDELYVAPTGHFLMGGLRIDERSATTVHGVFAAGESAGGVHGANRLGGNGLSEALVFGRIAGREAARAALEAGLRPVDEPRVKGHFEVPCAGDHCAEELIERLRTVMYWKAGPVRDAGGLEEALACVTELGEQAGRCGVGTGSRAAARVQTWMDLRNLTLASRLIVEAALARHESRGAHFRSDHQHTCPEYTARVFRMGPGEELTSFAVTHAAPERGTA
jgi:succinate dehydrogenase/fumarate reductase flavoprotein subunit